jgi:transposase
VHRDFCQVAIARILEPHVAEVVLAHAKQVRAISHARIKTDTIDAKILADLLAADLIPAVWIGDERCRMVRRLVSRRRELVKRRTQIKNEISAVLHRNLKGRSSASDPFGNKGRGWIAEQQLPIDERLTVDAGLRQLDFVGGELAEIDRVIAQEVLGDRAPDLRPAARARTSRPLRGGTIICSPTRPRPVHCSRSRERSSRGGRPERDRKSSVPAAGVFIASCLHCSQAQDVARSFAA